MYNKKVLALPLLCVATLLFAGCGESTTYNSSAVSSDSLSMAKSAYENDYEYVDDYSGDYDYDGSSDYSEDIETEKKSTERKLIYTSSIDIEAKNNNEFDAICDSVKKLIDDNDAYIESSYQNGSEEDSSSLYIRYTVRVPYEHYNDLMSCASELGNVTNKQEEIEDVTSDYVDIEARLSSKQAYAKTLKELLSTAETTSEAIEIYSELEEVNSDIESFKAQLNSYDDKVDYSTVDITVERVAIYTSTHNGFKGWLSSFGNACINTWISFIKVIGELIIACVYFIPYAIVAVGIIVLVKKNKRKKAQTNSQTRQASSNKPQVASNTNNNVNVAKENSKNE